MRKFSKLFTLLLLLSLATNIFAQAGALVIIGKGIFGHGNKDKKKEKIIKSSTSQVEINGAAISILRVKDAEIKSDAKDNIIKIQNRLDEFAQQYKNNEHLNIPKKDKDIATIKSTDPEWPAEMYDNEYNAYKKYQQKFEKSDLHQKDSIEAINIGQRKKIDDSLALVNKHSTDSLEYFNRVKGYNFINKDFVLIKETPSDKGKTLGKLYVGSYIKVLDNVDKSQFVKVSLNGIQGFVDKNNVVDNIDKITVLGADLKTYKNKVYCKYEAKP